MSFRTLELSDAAFLGGGIHHVTVKSAALRRRADVSFYIPEAAKAPGDAAAGDPAARCVWQPLGLALQGGAHACWIG